MRRVILMALMGAAVLCARTAGADPFTVVLANAHAGSGGVIWFGALPESDTAFGSALIIVGHHKSDVSDAIITLTAAGSASGVFDSTSGSWHAVDASDFLGGLTSGATFTHGHGAGGALSAGASADIIGGSGKGGSGSGDDSGKGASGGASGKGGSGASVTSATASGTTASSSSSAAVLAATVAGASGVLTTSSAIATNPEPSPLLLAASGLVVFLLWKRLRTRTAF